MPRDYTILAAAARARAERSRVDSPEKARYNQGVERISRLRAEKKRLVASRDAALSPEKRLRLGAAHVAAARALFMAGLAARGFSRREALREWRRALARPG